MMKALKEFKDFISKGNVLDLAVGVIIGGAFSSIVTSLVNNIFTPIIGMVLGGKDFSNLAITVGNAKVMYGAFIQSVIDFLLVALCLFLVVKIVNTFNNEVHKLSKHGKEEKKDEKVVPVKSADIVLLEEIRDLLKENNKPKKGKSK